LSFILVDECKGLINVANIARWSNYVSDSLTCYVMITWLFRRLAVSAASVATLGSARVLSQLSVRGRLRLLNSYKAVSCPA
jgi:hypothetical protein